MDQCSVKRQCYQLRGRKVPKTETLRRYKFATRAFKLGIGLPTELAIGAFNLFSKTDLHWGTQFRWGWPEYEGDKWGANVFSFGFGDYSHCDAFGQPREKSFFNLVCYPNDGLIGLRLAIGAKKAVNYIDVLPRLGGGQLHFNVVEKNRKRPGRTGGDEHTIDFYKKTPPWPYR